MNSNLTVSSEPTIGQIPLALIQLGRRLYRRGLVGSPRFKSYQVKPQINKPESET